MKNTPSLMIILFIITVFAACNPDKKEANPGNPVEEIFKTEEAFNKALKELGIQDAFYMFADENAVIKRQNDSLVYGKENIRIYYQDPDFKNVDLTWKPDYADVSEDGTMAYTYGKYSWKNVDSSGKPVEYEGIFHTVWKKQKNGTWKYVWD